MKQASADTQPNKKARSRKGNLKWVITITITAFALSAFFSFLSIKIFDRAGLFLSGIVLLLIISTGIIFDIIGIAVTAADETPLHGMAARKRRGARQALKLIRHASRVSSFCNDVVGDICGIISGAAVGLILLEISLSESSNLAAGIILTAFSTALTIGGKAVGKIYAMKHSNRIVYMAGTAISFLKLPIKFNK